MQHSTRLLLLGSSAGFLVGNVGFVRSLTELGALLNANPSLNVTMLGNYNAAQDGTFAASPLGTTAATTYTGTFDGGGYSIRNFSLLDTSDVSGLEDGLFGNVGDNSGNGTVKNLTVYGSIVQTAWERTVRDGAGRYLLGTTIGGVVASLRGTVDNCVSYVSVYGSGSGGQFGGLVGRNEQWPNKTITGITQANPGVVTVANHGIPTGQRIALMSVGGMTQVNGQVYTVTSLSANTFSIGVDTSGYSAYTSGGVAMGAGTVKNCTSSAAVALNIYNYNTYQSALVASNRGLIDNCVTTAGAVCTAAGNTQPNPPTADYTAGWTGAASISGTTMNVTATSLGAMAVGLNIFAPNSVAGTVVAANTVVTQDLGGGNWQVSVSQTVSSRDLMAATGTAFLTTGSWMGGTAGDNGLPAVGDSPTALIKNSVSYIRLQNSNNLNSANLTGGIVGYQGDGITQDCQSFGAVTGGSSVGGVIGFNALTSSIVRRSGSRGAITGTVGNIGGVTGQDYGTTSQCWASGSVTGTTAVGGVIGLLRDTGTAADLFAFGNVTGTVGVGGLVGQAIAGATLSRAYSLGVPTGTSKVGGSIGNRAASVTVADTYWDIDSSGNPVGVGSGVTTGVSGLSDAALLAGMPSGFGSEWSRGVITPNYPVLNTAATPPNPTVSLNPPLSMSFVDSATSVDSTNITMPAGIAAGDWAYLIDFAQNTTSTAPSQVTPTNWTLVNQQFSNATNKACRIVASRKILDGTETTVAGMTTGTRGRMMIVQVFRPSNPVTGDTWTQLNARVVIDGAAGGTAAQSMGAGTSPAMVVGCAVYDAGTPPTNQISLGDDAVITATSAITPSLVARASYHISNTGAAASTYNGDVDAGGVAIICVNVSLS